MNKRWTYKVVELQPGFLGTKAQKVEEALNELGAKGWELVAASKEGSYWQLVLKKEL